MKKIINKINFAALLLLAGTGSVLAQEAKKSPLSVSVGYHLVNNQAQFVVATLKTKVERRFMPAEDVEVKFYLDKDSASGGVFLGKGKSNTRGRVSMAIAPTAQNAWKASADHKIVAMTAKTDKYNETSTEGSVIKTRVTLDTAEEKGVKMTFEEWKGDKWSPVPGVEFKLGIKRLLSDLNISETETYVTDSLGQVAGTFKREKLPGDEHSNIVLVAKFDDNDTWGSLRFEKTVPWGVVTKKEGGAIGRELWGGRFHSPWWLIAFTYSIIIGVWGTVFYLIYMILKIRTIGKSISKKK